MTPACTLCGTRVDVRRRLISTDALVCVDATACDTRRASRELPCPACNDTGYEAVPADFDWLREPLVSPWVEKIPCRRGCLARRAV